MALELKFKRSLDSDGKLTFTDITGDYDAISNEGGYGTPNPARTDLNIVEYTTFGGGEKVVSEAYSTSTASQIKYQISKDGVYDTAIYALPISYTYDPLDEQDLIDNAVATATIVNTLDEPVLYGHMDTRFASRKKFDIFERLNEDDCKLESEYMDLYNYIEVQLFGAAASFSNGLPFAAHQVLVDLTKYIQKSTI